MSGGYAGYSGWEIAGALIAVGLLVYLVTVLLLPEDLS